MTELELFAMPNEPPPAESPDQRRTRRQREAIAHGVHPLALVLRRVTLHPDAPRPTGPHNNDPGPRCGDCAHRTPVNRGTSSSYPKCTYGGHPWPRATGSAATDVRAWWPACTDHTPAEA